MCDRAGVGVSAAAAAARTCFFAVAGAEALMDDTGLVCLRRPSVFKPGSAIKTMLFLSLVSRRKGQTWVGASEVKICLCFGKGAS